MVLLAGISTAVGLVAAWFILTGRAPDGLRLQGPLRLAAAAIMAYAIVKHHAFGIDLALKWTLTRGTIIAAFAGAFFVVEQIAQFYVSVAYGTAAGILAALLLLLAFKPLRKFAHRLADRVFPGVEPTPEYYDARRLVVYRAAAQTAYKDGVVTAKERSMLDALVRELRIPEHEARGIERAVGEAAAL